MADLGQFSKAVREMANYRQMTTAKLVEYEQYFVSQLGSFGSDPRAQIYEQQCQAQIESLRSAISRRWLAEQSERQYREASETSEKRHRESLWWIKLAAFLTFVVPVILALISQLPFSKFLHARKSKASTPTYRSTPTPTAALPEPEASSNSATPSPTQTGTIQPSVSPPES